MKKTKTLLASLALAALATTLPVHHAGAEAPVSMKHQAAIQSAQKAIEAAERQICVNTTYLVWSLEARRRYPGAPIDKDALVKAAELGPCGTWQDASTIRRQGIRSSFKLEAMAQKNDDYAPVILAATVILRTNVRRGLCNTLADIYGEQFNRTRAGAFFKKSVIAPYFNKACSIEGSWELPNENMSTRDEALEFLMDRLAPLPDKATRGGGSLYTSDKCPLVG